MTFKNCTVMQPPTIIKIRTIFVTPRVPLCPFVVNPSPPHPAPGNPWTVSCPYGLDFPFPEFHFNGLIQEALAGSSSPRMVLLSF